MAFSFKSLFTGGRSGTLSLQVEESPQETAIGEEVRKDAEAPVEDPLQQALLKEFLAQEFLVQASHLPAAEVILPPDFEAKLGLGATLEDAPAEIQRDPSPKLATPAPVDAITANDPKAEPVIKEMVVAAPKVEAPIASAEAHSVPAVAAPVAVAEKVPELVAQPEAEEPRVEPSTNEEEIESAINLDELLANIELPAAPRLSEPTGEVFEVHAQTVPALADVAPDAYVLKPRVDPSEWALEETLALHKEWLDTHGASGQKADLRKGNFDNTELISVGLRYADLQDINLKAADLLLADLRDACLVRANFSEACLVGTNLEGANLEGASLENSMGLVSRQIAGANVHEASLPVAILEFRGLVDFARTSATAVRLFTTLLALSAISLLMIWKTRDVQLLSDSGILSFLPSRALAAALPSDQLYMVAPALLLVVYVWFLYNLQRVWDAVLELPAVFPDGKVLGEDGPRIVLGLLRAHFRWMNAHAPSTRTIEKTLSLLLAYWMVPIVMLAFWARYLTVQDFHGTLLQEALLLLSIAIAFYCTTQTGRPAESWIAARGERRPWLDKLKAIQPTKGLALLFGVLTFLSVGTIYGVPHDTQRAPQYGTTNIRRWAPTLLWTVGIDPYAELTEASISRKPAGWNGSDAALGDVTGARLIGSNFRYAQAYAVFLANAHLFRANFNGAFMSEADMRGADLSQSTLQNANLDRAQMGRVNLDRAALDDANLSRADLRGANLSYATLTGATLIDVRMDGASLYGSHLENATIIRGNLNKADLRDAHLDGANLEHSDLREAYFWSAKLPGANLRNAQLAAAIFIDADLSRADLSGAQFNGTVLNGANLRDANLDGADLRGALQLTAAQVCSAKSIKGAQMDDALQTQVDASCGTGPRPPAASVTTPAVGTAPAVTTTP
jgi:uncharacterized protein YjbI with pentapeptide repeats